MSRRNSQTKPTRAPTYPVALACGHNANYPAPVPVPGQPAWCYACDDYRRVISPDIAS